MTRVGSDAGPFYRAVALWYSCQGPALVRGPCTFGGISVRGLPPHPSIVRLEGLSLLEMLK